MKPQQNTQQLMPDAGILILSQHFYPESISTGQTITELAENLVKAGIQCEVWCGYPTTIKRETRVPKRLDYRGIKIIRVRSSRFPKLELPGRILNQLSYALSVFISLLLDRSGRPVLVLTSPPFLGIACALNRFLGRNPFILLVFDVFPDVAVTVGMLKPKGLITRTWNVINRFIFSQATHIVVIGRCMKERIEFKLKLTAEAQNKVVLLPMWTDTTTIQPVPKQSNPLIASWGLQAKFVIGYFGNMGKSHDIETIIEAATILRSQSDLVFLFVSEGYKKKQVMARVAELGLENCQFRSYVERDQLSFSLSCADIGLVSLENGHEGLSVPSKTFAMMAAQIPVVAVMPEASEIARMISEENCGFVVKPGDATTLATTVSTLWQDHNLRHTLGANARTAAQKKFDVSLVARDYYRLILQMQSSV